MAILQRQRSWLKATVSELLLLLLGTFPVSVQAQFNYTINAGTVAITGYTGPRGDVVIPSTIEGLPVTSIAQNAFSGSDITSVTIPDSVTRLGDYSFYECYRMTNIVIGAKVANIGKYSLTGCIALLSIEVNSSNVVYSSDNGILFDKSQTTLLTFPSALGGSYTIPNTVKNIGDQGFLLCRTLTDVIIPNGITNIGQTAFDQCTALTHIAIPDSVRSIGIGAFSSCSNLRTIDLGNGATSLAASIFAYCTSLTQITIGSGITNIATTWVDGCVKLTTIAVDPLNSVYSSLDGVLFNKDQTALIKCPVMRAGTYSIPATVTNIEGAAFGYCANLTEIIIPGSVSSIGRSAFYSCVGLSKLIIPSEVASIGATAFSMCTNLSSVTLGPNVLFLPGQIFSGCLSLSKVYFEGDAPFTDPTAFADANNATLYFLAGTAGWGQSLGGRPTALWSVPFPSILTNDGAFGVRSSGFGFNFAWAPGMVVVLEACDNLTRPVWIALQTNTLMSSLSSFSDPRWTVSASHFYRFRSLSPTNASPLPFKTLHSFSAGSDGGILYGGVVLSHGVLYGTTSYGGVNFNSGTVFAINTDGSSFTNVHNFTGGDGGAPYAGLALSSNSLFGTTGAGGAFYNGNVFRVDTDGSDFTNLYSFSALNVSLTNADGSLPFANVVLSGDTLYGTTGLGGGWGDGTVFKLKTDGTDFGVLYNFMGPTNALQEAAVIVFGNTLYGTGTYGGASSNGAVYVMNIDGTGLTNLYSFSGGIDGRNPYGGLTLSGDTLFGTTAGGGSSNAGTIFSIHTNGTSFATLHSFTSGNDGAEPVAALVVSGTKIYGTAAHGGRWGGGTVFSLNTDGTEFTILHTFSPWSGSPPINDDGFSPVAPLVLSGTTLYGTAQWGGQGGYGTVFSISLPGNSP